MIKNLFLVALRNLKKDKWYSLLNILGLTIGIAFSLLLIFYVRDELSYDRYNKNADRIYRINSYIQERDKNTNWCMSQFPLGPVLKKEFPEVLESVRFAFRERTLFKYGNKNFYETKIYYVDSNVFKMFSAKFLEGNPATALNEPFSLVISKTLAEKYFGKYKQALGQTLRTVYDVYKVTGVIEDIPQNAHIRYDILISMSSSPFVKYMVDNWGSFNNYTYVLLAPGASPASLNRKLDQIYHRSVEPLFSQFNVKMKYDVEPITDIHLHSKLEAEPEALGSMNYIWIFSAVAFFMLLIACINYMNLTTARSARRAKEIGIRKVTGSTKVQLVMQFLNESVLTALVAVILSFGLVLLLLPSFNQISGKAFSFRTLVEPSNMILVLGIALLTGLVGGSYPAFYLSAFRPVSVLKGTIAKASGNVNLRRTLVVLQFSIAMTMLICTWIVYDQLKYLRSTDLGFDKNQIMTVIVNTGENEKGKIFSMNNEFRRISAVQSVGAADAYPGSPGIDLDLFVVQTDHGTINKAVECYNIDENYLNTLRIPIVRGRNFASLADTLHGILVNEALVKHFGWKEPIGKRITFPKDTTGRYFEVKGIFKDFHQKSLYNPIAPLILFYGPNGNMIQIKMASANIKETIGQVEAVWKKFFPQLPFEYKFLDEGFYSQYESDQKRGQIFGIFSALTIIITCLGLLGLTAFTTQQKQKEISIRRVMGASIANIVSMITRNYLWLALIAACIAFPVAYYFMSQWLKVFSYNPGLSAFPFIASALLIAISAIVTSSIHSARAALAKPAKNLRTE